jgi:hypothetical protein
VQSLEPESVKYHVAFSPFLPFLWSHLKYECHPEVIQVIPCCPGCAAVQDLTLKDRWHQEEFCFTLRRPGLSF